MSPTPDGVIPYIDVHDGPKRYVTVSIGAFASILGNYSKSMMVPTLSVDGRAFLVYWGQVTVEAPADRPVHLAVGMQDGVRGASLLLPAGPDAVTVDYFAPSIGAVTFAVRPPGAPPPSS